MGSATIDRRMGLTGDKGMKAPVDLATTVSVLLSGEQTIDGVLTSSSRVLVWHQVNQIDNGIYDTNSGSWTRAIDANGNQDLVKGTLFYVNGGTVNGGLFFLVTSSNPVLPGSTAIVFGQSVSASFMTSLLSSAGASLIGFIQAGIGAVARLIQDKLFEIPTLLDYIPVSEHAAIKAYTSTLDVTDYINAALAANRRVRATQGGYFHTRPINMSARRDASGGGTYSARQLIGDGMANTQFNSYTGVYPMVDLTGSSNCLIEGINFRSDNPGAFGLVAANCASVGIFNCRGSTVSFNQSCQSNRFIDVRLNMTSDMTRNSSAGTVGFYNVGGEHLIGDSVEIYANIPMALHNVAQITVSHSSAIPTYGTQYEPVYAGSAISCTIMEFRSMRLIAWDTFRAVSLYQVAQVDFTNLYTSTRKLSSVTPAYTETFHMDGSCANIYIECYQEVSGLFGATYLMDHRYLTIGGLNENIIMRIQRGALDQGFNNPGAAQPSVMLLASTTLNNSDINCNYLIGVYASSGDNNGFAALPVAVTGVSCLIHTTKFTLDHSGSHASDIFSVIGPYCVNVDSVNYFSAESYYGATSAAMNPSPTVVGLTSAGAGTYSEQLGYFSKSGRSCYVQMEFAWSAHTGTGSIGIAGLPFTAYSVADQILQVSYNGLVVGAGKTLTARVNANTTTITLLACDPAGGALAAVAMDTAVAALTISGTYRISGSV